MPKAKMPIKKYSFLFYIRFLITKIANNDYDNFFFFYELIKVQLVRLQLVWSLSDVRASVFKRHNNMVFMTIGKMLEKNNYAFFILF